MSETVTVGGFEHWQDADGIWWWRDHAGAEYVATTAACQYLDALAARERELAEAQQRLAQLGKTAADNFEAAVTARAALAAAEARMKELQESCDGLVREMHANWGATSEKLQAAEARERALAAECARLREALGDVLRAVTEIGGADLSPYAEDAVARAERALTPPAPGDGGDDATT